VIAIYLEDLDPALVLSMMAVQQEFADARFNLGIVEVIFAYSNRIVLAN
jgi:hypothetical protein